MLFTLWAGKCLPLSASKCESRHVGVQRQTAVAELWRLQMPALAYTLSWAATRYYSVPHPLCCNSALHMMGYHLIEFVCVCVCVCVRASILQCSTIGAVDSFLISSMTSLTRAAATKQQQQQQRLQCMFGADTLVATKATLHYCVWQFSPFNHLAA